MTRINNVARITFAVLLLTAVALPGFAQARGAADFTRFVAVGDSYGAGYEAGSLNQRHQLYGWPTIIARQVGLTICPVTAVASDTCFAVPFITDPGLPGAELTFTGTGVVTPPGSGSPVMFGFGRAFNNLSVPGYTVGAALGLTGAEANSGLGQVILRGRGTEVAQALSLNPTFIAVWLGGNDFLGAVSNGNPAQLTSVATFTAQYNALLDALTAGAPNAGMVVGTLPTNFASTPLTSRLPGVVFDSNFQPVLVNGSQVPLFYLPAGATTPAAVPAGSIVLLSALSRYQQGYGIPPALKGAPPFNALPHAGEPLTDAEVITPAEQAVFATTIDAYNAAIIASAAAHKVPVADIKGVFNRFATPISVGGITLSNTFISGGIFSNDGAHLTDIGYTIFANEYIRTINNAYGTRIPFASIASLFQNNGANFGIGGKATSMNIDPETAKAMTAIFTSATVESAPVRRRAGH
jgi:lysophospholipase L1-like esterase